MRITRFCCLNLAIIAACAGDNGADGEDGEDGEDGMSSLVRVDDEPPGENCPYGGVAIHTGIDANANGILDDDEISDTRYVCDGPPPPPTFEQVAKLVPSDSAANQRFGRGVAATANTTVIGMVGQIAGPTTQAYVFERDSITGSWLETATLTRSDTTSGDNFAEVVAIDGDVIAVSSRNDDDGGASAGAVYVFERDGTWTETQKLIASDAAVDDQFGLSVDVSGTRIAVGC
ncbi:MAG: hypothetical protein D6689_13170 [Deltaproteobacteria bacterium]|nr:MAG: hypothetical protein D6689_13170 [Deltaproteobacteria bacterium]